ncbi:MAG: hypothetical protein ACTHMV_13650 [Chitinophagaceae bacterium]
MKTTTKLYTIKVPTKTYLRKYATVKYGTELKYNSTLGIILLSFLEKKVFSTKMNEADVNTRLQYMNDFLVFTSSIKTAGWKGLHLSQDKVIAINRFLESNFVEEMHSYCCRHKKNQTWRPGIDKAIHSFAEQYGIIVDVDITFDALKKSEYRYRRALEEKKVSFVPSFSRRSSHYVIAYN